MKQTFFKFGILVLLCLTAYMARGQVSVSPVSLYIDENTGIASLYIRNGQDMAREVEITFNFGYPASDSAGNLAMKYNDTHLAVKNGLNNRLRAFPRNFVMEPGGQQTVRLQVLPMNEQPDGVYWTRLVVKSSQQARDIEEHPLTEGVGAKINYVFRQNIPVFYGKGSLNTAIRVAEVKTQFTKGRIIVIARLEKSGNAPWNGTVTASLRDEENGAVAEKRQTLLAYYNVLRRIEMELPGEKLPAGEYQLELVFETKRSDVSPDDLVQAAPLRHTVNVKLE